MWANRPAVAQVGDDTFGADYLANLRKSNIDTEFVKTTAQQHSGVAQISVAETGAHRMPPGVGIILLRAFLTFCYLSAFCATTGDNTIVIVPGANTCLSAADVHAARQRVEEADVALFQFETPIGTTLEALRLRRAAGKGRWIPAQVASGHRILLTGRTRRGVSPEVNQSDCFAQRVPRARASGGEEYSRGGPFTASWFPLSLSLAH